MTPEVEQMYTPDMGVICFTISIYGVSDENHSSTGVPELQAIFKDINLKRLG
jgi:hypothetical protein